ncbi:hypothetical protein TNCV_2936721 [Trichonephila clavipes]|nr:hypothetical protein TNCV_2936721 [Trichonephila clavipes]
MIPNLPITRRETSAPTFHRERFERNSPKYLHCHSNFVNTSGNITDYVLEQQIKTEAENNMNEGQDNIEKVQDNMEGIQDSMEEAQRNMQKIEEK